MYWVPIAVALIGVVLMVAGIWTYTASTPYESVEEMDAPMSRSLNVAVTGAMLVILGMALSFFLSP